MAENEALEKLRAYLKCQRLQVKGICEDCNEKLCDNCDLCYAQGNTGEHIKSIEIAIQALEKQIPKKVVKDGKQSYKCPYCGESAKTETGDSFIDYRLDYCDGCGQHLDWSDEE
nr:MAG TPA: zinc-ribbon domain protein [Bacteriophage sp.]